MFIVEYGNSSPVLLEYLDGLLKEFESRILDLTFFVDRVLAMFSNNDDSIDSQFTAAAAQRFGDRRIYCEPVLCRTLSTQVAFRLLVCIQRDHFDRGTMPPTMTRISDEKSVAHMLSV